MARLCKVLNNYKQVNSKKEKENAFLCLQHGSETGPENLNAVNTGHLDWELIQESTGKRRGRSHTSGRNQELGGVSSGYFGKWFEEHAARISMRRWTMRYMVTRFAL